MARAFHALAGLCWIGFFGFVLAAWTAILIAEVEAPPAATLELFGLDAWRALCRASAADASFPGLFGMWAAMAAAMMAPTAAPALATYLRLPAPAPSALGFGALAVGYMGVWLGFAAIAALAQRALAAAALLAPNGASVSPWLSAALLGLAGAYQFSRLKRACLNRCRTPLGFFIARWAEGPAGALRMGVALGAACLGCCWALMLLGFVFGVMNLAWMALAMALMMFEKLPDIGRWITAPLGALLLAGAGWRLLLALGAA